MNHWFLVARDIMWIVIATYPLIAFSTAISMDVKKDDTGLLSLVCSALIISSLLVQYCGITALRMGLIK